MTGGHGVIWDFDGTLAERPGLWAACLLELLTEDDPRTPIMEADIAALMHTGFPWHAPDRPHPHLCDPALWWEEMTRLLTGILERLGYRRSHAWVLASRMRGHYMNGDIGWRVFPEAAAALRQLADRGFRQVILSNHAPELPSLVERLGLADFFDTIITSAITGFEKPHESAYKSAVEALPPGARLWMVGDNEEADALSPERHGIQGVLVCRGTRRQGRARRQVPDLARAVDLILSTSEG
jgi:putative hydrolase of the HAD superfamily